MTSLLPYRIQAVPGMPLPRLAPFLHGLYQFSWQEVEGVLCLAMQSREDSLPAFPYLGRQVAQVAGTVGVPVVLLAASIPLRMQQRLVQEKLPFISGQGALFLPFLGACALAEQRVWHRPMTPLAQLVALWHVYSGEESFYAHGLAERLGVSLMGISNACAALVETGVYTRRKEGRLLVLHSEHGRGAALFAALRPFLSSPVAASAYLHRADMPPDALLAGESALPSYSRLAEPGLLCVALPRRQAKALPLVPELVDEAAMCRVELWRYNPAPLGRCGVVDPLSLCLSMGDAGDPRLQQALEQALEQAMKHHLP